MKSWLADIEAKPHHPDVGTLPLTCAAPTTDDLRRGVASLEGQLRTADYDHIVFCVAKLISGFNERLTKDEAKARARLWQEVISDVPKDLWSAGTMELLRSWKRDEHYGRVPEASDLLACIESEMSRRRTALQHCKAGLSQANGPEAKPGPIRVPEKVRLKRILEEQRTQGGVSGESRLFNMANTERALAMAEKRFMAPWALQFFNDKVAAEGGREESIGQRARASVLDRYSHTRLVQDIVSLYDRLLRR